VKIFLIIAIIIGVIKGYFIKIVNPEIITPIIKNEVVGNLVLEPTITINPTIRPTKIPVVKVAPTIDTEPWGVAKQIGEHTYTMKINQDPAMGSPKEILDALNEYRRRNGVAVLMWDEKLANYAQFRAVYFNNNKSLDEHKGFIDFLNNEDGFNKLSFTSLGENSSFGYKLTGVHLIEWIYAGDEPHNKNQLNKDWAYVGIGVQGSATCLIFGTGKM
jgi:uncharacterized protein YkwD